MNSLTAFVFMCISNAQAFTTVKAIIIPPNQFGPKPPMSLRQGQVISNGTLVSATQGKVVFSNSKAEITALGPFEASFESDDSLKIKFGRFLVQSKSQTLSNAPLVKTENASYNTKGGRFLAAFMHTVKESEVIAFDGEVDFDKRIIKKNQWSGKGGRYGQKTTEPITFALDVLNFFSQDFNLR